jgi:ubiquitin-conjugating enzyme E2 D/E
VKKKVVYKGPKEAIVVLYDVSGSMGCSFFDDKEISRMGAVNAFFSAFADKTMAFEFNHLVQLYYFSNEIIKMCNFTSNFQEFINLVDSANANGCTKLYDCMDEAITSLLDIKKKYPQIILRMIALTDGEDNDS